MICKPLVDFVKAKSPTFTWECVFTKINHPDKNAVSHGNILAEIAQLVDHGKLRIILTRRLGKISAANIHSRYALIASSRSISRSSMMESASGRWLRVPPKSLASVVRFVQAIWIGLCSAT